LKGGENALLHIHKVKPRCEQLTIRALADAETSMLLGALVENILYYGDNLDARSTNQPGRGGRPCGRSGADAPDSLAAPLRASYPIRPALL